MSKFELTPWSGGRPPLRVKLSVPGLERQYRITPGGWDFLIAMAKRWDLPFRFEEREEWRYIHPEGIVTNANALMGWTEARRQRGALLEQRRILDANIAQISAIVADRPHFNLISKSFIHDFVRTLPSWDEMLEAGVPGEELANIPPRFEVPVDASYGVRFQPALFRKYVAGKEFWAMTPPMPFTLHADHFQAQTIGHPHVYAGMHLCIGDARFDYGNPFQALATLREWYLGYQERDVANKQWLEHSRMWWRANGEAFLQRGDAYVIEGPDERHELSAKVKLSPERARLFIDAPGWVPGEVVEEGEEAPARRLLPEGAFFESGRAEEERPCALENGHVNTYYYVRVEGRTHFLCVCHLAEAGLWPDRTTFPDGDQDLEAVDEEDGYRCDMWQYLHGYLPSRLENNRTPAQWRIHLRTGQAYVCDAHARLLVPNFLGGAKPTLRGPITAMKKVVLAGELGANRRLREQDLSALFPNLNLLWRSTCKECGEELQLHWGLLCPTKATHVLPVGHFANRTQQPLRSFSSFEEEEYATVQAEVEQWKQRFAEAKDVASVPEFKTNSFVNLIGRLRTTKGTALDEKDRAREFFVIDTLRKFGREVTTTTRCTDCGRTWKDHVGPICPDQ